MTALLRVEQPGLFTTVQDLGRPNAVASGVSPGGAMDRFAHRAANLLAGNEPGAATLECTLRGPRLVAEHDCLVAITGADLEPRVNGQVVEMWAALALRPGDELRFGSRRSGARAYVAIAGGVAGDRWLGSLSTNLLAQRGGMRGRALQAGDVIAAAGGPSRASIPGRRLAPELRPDYGDGKLCAIAGPHAGRLGAEGHAALFASPFIVSHDSDRMGYRLDGPPLAASGDEVLSFGLVSGAVQLPAGGRPILLMADHQTAGGYPVVATVVSASLPIAAQLVPGDELRFVKVTIEAAARLRHARDTALASLRE
jgi:antagonist of KipI